MSDVLFSFNAVAPIFILVALGFLLTKLKVWNDDFLKLANRVCFTVFLPVMLFYNIYKSDFSRVWSPRLIGFIIIAVTVLFAISCLIVPRFTKDGGRRGAIIQALFRGNYLLLGVPICQSMFGDAGGAAAAVAAAFIIPYFNILATVVLSIYSRDTKISLRAVILKIIKNPLIIASVLGMLAVAVGLSLPTVIDTVLLDIRGIGTPLSLLILGGDFKLRELRGNLKPIIATSAARLILVPAVMLTAAYALGFRGVELGVLVSVFGTPVAVSSYVMTHEMRGDYVLAGQLIVATTFGAMFTTFLFVYALRAFGLA
ncbi:MAG: AEC family transporter [Clostridia bacterium]